MKKTWLSMAALALIVAGCSSTEDNLPVDLTDTPIKVNATVNPIAASLALRGGDAKGDNTGENTGDNGGRTVSDIAQFNLKITNPNNNDYSYEVVMKPSLGNVSWLAYDTQNNVKQMLWQNSDTKVSVKASTFAISTEAVTLAAKANQSDADDAGFKASDHLMWDNAEQEPLEAGINVEFGHIMAKLNIDVTLGNEYNLTVNPIESVVIGGTKIEGSFHRTTGWTVADATAATEVKAHNTGAWTTGDAPTAKYEAILVPQTLKAGSFSVTFTITVDGNSKDYTWNYPGADKEMEQGKCYTLTLKAGKDKVEGVSLTPTAWTNNDGNLATD